MSQLAGRGSSPGSDAISQGDARTGEWLDQIESTHQRVSSEFRRLWRDRDEVTFELTDEMCHICRARTVWREDGLSTTE